MSDEAWAVAVGVGLLALIIGLPALYKLRGGRE